MRQKATPLNERLITIFATALLAATVFALCGCSTKEPAKDAFFEKWRLMAEQSQGHSPTFDPEYLKRDQFTVQQTDIIIDEDVKPAPPLPQLRISLRMHKANIVAVLQALARAAGQSIMISPNVSGEVTVNIMNMPWDQIFEGIIRTNGLSYAWEGDIIRIMTLEDMEQDLRLAEVIKKQQTQKLQTRQGEPPIMSVIKLKYARAEKLKEEIEALLSKDEDGESVGTVQVDTETNALIMQANRTEVNKIIKLVERLDRPRQQVKIKAHIVETTDETARALGIQWGGFRKFTNAGFGDNNLWLMPSGNGIVSGDPSTGVSWTYTPAFGPGLSDSGFAMNFPPTNFPSGSGQGAALSMLFGELGGNILEMQLSALQEQDKLKILSSPSITTLDNELAFTENGASVPFVTISDGERQVEFKDAVLRLEIQPQIIDSEHLRMSIKIKKDEVDLTRTVEGNPLIVKKNTETTLITRNNETVVISGLTKRTVGENEAGTPGAMDIPALGWLFKTEGKSNSMEEVLIFITPTILAEWQPGEYQKDLGEIEEELADQGIE